MGTVIGVDEVGRGSLAGPVCAAAAWVDGGALPDEWWASVGWQVRDSKRLSARRREGLVSAAGDGILSGWLRVGIGWGTVAEIAAHNILGATTLAMRRALAQLGDGAWLAGQDIRVDGKPVAGLGVAHTALVKGDDREFAIALASICAKVERDGLMAELGERWPGYGFVQNAGYGTAAHRAALRRLGVTPEHRLGFLGKLGL